ncbi:hypothetical protein HAX54_002825 [Datura stramonium]|uniref:BHLH domain-containing protein n=1 Tax=Datura stramonium TaxID=4076 RepID=A0ABS8T4G5_DATST|nr:hypothetical protein [Datura stramonium]
MDNNDLALIFSHHMQGNYNGETSRKRLHEELDEKADDLSCIISFTSYSQQQQQLDALNLSLCAEFGIESDHMNLLRSHANNENIVNFGAQFEGNARRTRVQAQEHLLAERKRRQKISKLFVSLASLLPGLNKMDKASILEGATNLIRQLGERAETTEDHTKTNNEKEDSSIDMMMKSSSLLPQVEVKSSEEELLITILLLYPKKQQKGIIDQILSTIQRFHLTIKTSSFMPFGSTSMHITVIAQMNAEFCETTDFLAKKLRSSIIKL